MFRQIRPQRAAGDRHGRHAHRHRHDRRRAGRGGGDGDEDIQRIGGSEALDEPYIEIAFGRMIQKRAGWLTALFLGEMLTATAMGVVRSGDLERAVVLALFVPLIISSGGNSGSQAATLVIRALALGEVGLA